MTAEEVPPGHRAIIAAVLARYGMTPRTIEPVPRSVLNRNYRVGTGDSTVFVRIHATKRDRDRLHREHRVAAWALAHGLPAVAPLADSAGITLQRHGGAFVSVHPWVDGHVATRGALTATEAATFGDLLGRLHVALAGYDDTTLEAGKVGSRWDTGESVAQLSRVDDLIRYYPAVTPEQLDIQLALRRQLGLLEGGGAIASTGFDRLARQPCHGDFHERNVLLGSSGEVAAVVDWELVSLLPPVFELLRAVTFIGLLDDDALLGRFLAAYRGWRALDRDECEAGVEMRWQAVLHSTWCYRAVYIEGNRSAAQFIPEHDRELRRFADPAFRGRLARRLATDR